MIFANTSWSNASDVPTVSCGSLLNFCERQSARSKAGLGSFLWSGPGARSACALQKLPCLAKQAIIALSVGVGEEQFGMLNSRVANIGQCAPINAHIGSCFPAKQPAISPGTVGRQSTLERKSKLQSHATCDMWIIRPYYSILAHIIKYWSKFT